MEKGIGMFVGRQVGTARMQTCTTDEQGPASMLACWHVSTLDVYICKRRVGEGAACGQVGTLEIYINKNTWGKVPASQHVSMSECRHVGTVEVYKCIWSNNLNLYHNMLLI